MAKWINLPSPRVSRIARYDDAVYPLVDVLKRTDKAALLKRVDGRQSAWVPLSAMSIVAEENAYGRCRVLLAAWIKTKLISAGVIDC